MAHLIALDQGTTSTRAIVFGADGTPRAQAQEPLRQIFPQPGLVEHDAEEIWAASCRVARAALDQSRVRDVAALGITNQRETTVLWDRKTLKPVYHAIVWQDRRTAALCDKLKAAGLERLVQTRTGLVIDPYFSASKIAWLLDNVGGLRPRAERGEIAFGTIDSWLIAKLTSGRVHATDVTNASRTLLFDINRCCWDDDLLQAFGVPRAILPDVRPCDGDFGVCDEAALGRALPIRGVAGDQQAALVGQGCVTAGRAKITFGTGAFLLHNTGKSPLASANRLLTTPGYATKEGTAYALEGSVFIAGAVVQWLRDGLGLFRNAAETAALAAQADGKPVYVVPAFTGLGAPYWDADARGAILGLTRDVGRADIVRAALESVSFQTHDLLTALEADLKAAGAVPPKTLNADGGMVANDWFMQNLADMLGLPVARAAMSETTARGAALLAGVGVGLFPSLDAAVACAGSDRIFNPMIGADERETRYAGWRDAVARVRSMR